MHSGMRWLLALLLALAFPAGASVTVTEVMYDPVQNDAYNEWVEIYADAGTDLGSWTLCGEALLPGYVRRSDGATYNNTTSVVSGYAVITDGGSGTEVYDNFSVAASAAFHTNSSSMCGGLGNTNDTIVLGNSTANVTFAYNSSDGGAGSNRTLCIVANQTKECTPTPGSANAVAENDLALASANTSLTLAAAKLFNVTSTGCSANTTLDYNVTNSTYNFSSSESLQLSCSMLAGNFTPPSAGSFVACGSLNVSAGINDTNITNNQGCWNITASELACNITLGIEAGDVYSGTVSYNITANDTQCQSVSHNITIEYWAEDLFSSVAKEKVNTTQNMTCFLRAGRQWTPDAFSGTEAYVLKARLAEGCAAGSNASATVVVKGSQPSSASAIAIASAPASAKFGEYVDIELDVYRGNTSKYAVELRVEGSGKNISEAATVHAKSKFTNYTFKVPVLLKSNCDSAFSAGSHTIKVSGLDAAAEKQIQINGTEGGNCKTITVTSGGGGAASTASKGKDVIVGILDFNSSVTAGMPFTTKVRITSNLSAAKNFSVYSYIFSGSSLLSEGGWTGNSKSILLAPRASQELVLENTPKPAPGVYSFRVRARADKDYDETRDIEIIAGSVPENVSGGAAENNSGMPLQENASLPEENATESGKPFPATPATGRAAADTADTGIGSAVEFFSGRYLLRFLLSMLGFS